MNNHKITFTLEQSKSTVYKDKEQKKKNKWKSERKKQRYDVNLMTVVSVVSVRVISCLQAVVLSSG